MNKKIILVWLFSSLLLTSCWTAKLWTFDEELKAEQARYVDAINTSFAMYEEASFWKFSTDWKISLWLDVPKVLKSSYWFDYKWDIISIDDWVSFNWEVWLNVNWWIDEKTENKNFKELSWVWIDFSSRAKIALDWTKFYWNLDELKFNLKNPNNNPQVSQAEMLNFDKIFEKIWKKWVFVDLSKYDTTWELKKAMSSQMESKIFMKELKDSLVKFVSWDVLIAWEKTTLNKKEAYKFTVDEAKLKSHLKNFAKDVLTSSAKISKISDEELKSTLEDANESIDKIKVLESEGYLVRAEWKDVDIIIKKLVLWLDGEDDKVESSVALLSDSVNFSMKPIWENFKDGENEFIMNIWQKEWKISLKDSWKQTFSMDYKDWKANFTVLNYSKVLWNFDYGNDKFSWNIKYFETPDSEKENVSIDLKWDYSYKYDKWNLNSKYNLSWDIFAEEFKSEWFEKINFNLWMEANQKKDEKIVIDEKTILWTEKALTSEEFSKLLQDAFPVFNWNIPE